MCFETIPIQALKHTYQLRGMASILRMRKTISPVGGSHGQLFCPYIGLISAIVVRMH